MDNAETLQEIYKFASKFKSSIEYGEENRKSIYEKYANEFLSYQLQSPHSKVWMTNMSIAEHELEKVYEYMISSSFISAFYHLMREKTYRDKAAHSCSNLVSSLGCDSGQVMLKYLEYERFWREMMKKEGVKPKLRVGLIMILIAVILFVYMIIFP